MQTLALTRSGHLRLIMCNKVTNHPVILTDIGNGRIVVADLDKKDPLADLLWEWTPDPKQGWEITTQQFLKEALSDVHFRWSEYHKTHVVLFTGSRGCVGTIRYPDGKCLWESMVGVSPHAIELLPNGDIVIAASGGGQGEKGKVHYLQLQKDGSYVAHGIVWDPQLQILWASGTDDVIALKLQADGTMSLIEGKGTKIPCSYGHDLMQDLSNPDILWVSPSPVVYQFSKSKNELMTQFPGSEVIHPLLRAKGIASFPDGVVVWVAYGHHTSSEHPAAFSALWPKEDGSLETISYTDENAGWNKVRILSDNYQ